MNAVPLLRESLGQISMAGDGNTARPPELYVPAGFVSLFSGLKIIESTLLEFCALDSHHHLYSQIEVVNKLYAHLSQVSDQLEKRLPKLSEWQRFKMPSFTSCFQNFINKKCESGSSPPLARLYQLSSMLPQDREAHTCPTQGVRLLTQIEVYKKEYNDFFGCCCCMFFSLL